MIDHVDNYEDAKRFLEKNMGGAYDKNLDKFLKLRTGFITLAMTAATVGIGASIGPEIALGFSPAIAGGVMVGLAPIMKKRRLYKEIENGHGKVYDGLTEEQTIRQANLQIDMENKEEAKRGMTH